MASFRWEGMSVEQVEVEGVGYRLVSGIAAVHVVAGPGHSCLTDGKRGRPELVGEPDPDLTPTTGTKVGAVTTSGEARSVDQA